MTAYREIVRDESDMTKVKALLDSLKTEVEIIILPIEKRDESRLMVLDKKTGEIHLLFDI